jgi:hypothetical protein
MISVSNTITRALRSLGLTSATKAPDGTQTAIANELLNSLIDSLSGEEFFANSQTITHYKPDRTSRHFTIGIKKPFDESEEYESFRERFSPYLERYPHALTPDTKLGDYLDIMKAVSDNMNPTKNPHPPSDLFSFRSTPYVQISEYFGELTGISHVNIYNGQHYWWDASTPFTLTEVENDISLFFQTDLHVVETDEEYTYDSSLPKAYQDWRLRLLQVDLPALEELTKELKAAEKSYWENHIQMIRPPCLNAVVYRSSVSAEPFQLRPLSVSNMLRMERPAHTNGIPVYFAYNPTDPIAELHFDTDITGSSEIAFASNIVFDYFEPGDTLPIGDEYSMVLVYGLAYLLSMHYAMESETIAAAKDTYDTYKKKIARKNRKNSPLLNRSAWGVPVSVWNLGAYPAGVYFE